MTPTAAPASAVASPFSGLSPELQRGMLDFFRIYEANYARLNVELLEALATHPQWGPLIQSMPVEQREEQNRISLELLRGAVIDGKWDPQIAYLRTQGALYAQMGFSFAAWYEVLAAFRSHLLPTMVQELVATPALLAAAILAMDRYVDITMSIVGEEYLNTKETLIHQQQQAIMELAAPVLPVRERLLLLPIVGMIDTQRARQITDGLLGAVRAHRARVVVIDITGVPAVDSKVANHLMQTALAARLMGAIPIMTGLSPDVAQALVALGVDLGRLITIGDLRGGIEEAERILGLRVVADKA